MRYLGMFDWYEPDPAIACSSCGAATSGWQGQDGANALFVWRQGDAHPVAQRADEPIEQEHFAEYSLPDRFRFLTTCGNGHELLFEGLTTDGVWTDCVELME